jgi:N-carbamoyl-D-amino-acid hydrolase
MREAKSRGCHFIVYPELALTTFFPRWYFPTQPEVDAWFEHEMPGPETQALFDEAKRLAMGFYLGYAEIAEEADGIHHYNTAIMVDPDGKIVGKYRKIHLPGHTEHEPWRAFQHLEKRYFECGNLGFPAYRAQIGGHNGIFGMALCNDRRWSETYRVLGLQGVEMSFIGYNTPIHYPQVPEHDHLQAFHNLLPLQAGAYQNGMWLVGVAKAGKEENCDLLGQSCIIAPTGEIVAMCSTIGDELATASCDLDRCKELKDNVFNFALHREPQHYGLIVETNGVIEPL